MSSKRQFIAGLSAAALAARWPARADDSGAVSAIDVHHHILPPFYREAATPQQIALLGSGFGGAAAQWTPARSLEEMDRNGIGVALVSISTPGIWFGGAAAASALARRCNEFAAQMCAEHRGRFGWFAALPLPDANASLRELAYALDELKADGVGLLTSYDSKWLGDPSFEPVMAELNRRRCIVFVHPTVAECCLHLLPRVQPGFIEFPFDTTRAVTNLLYSGSFGRYPDIRFIFSHGGGAVPMLDSRIKGGMGDPELARQLPHGVDYELARQFYDTASVSNRPAFLALSALVPLSQILFGTDYPLGPPVASSVSGLAELGLPAADLKRVRRDNAVALFPRFA